MFFRWFQPFFQHVKITADHVGRWCQPQRLLRQQDGIVPALVTRISGSTAGLIDAVRKDLESRPRISGSSTSLTLARTTSDVFTNAESIAKGMQDEYVSTEHLLLALCDSIEGKRLSQFGITKDSVLRALTAVRGRHWKNTDVI